MSSTTISNAADWHATMAMKAYRKKQWEDYLRHIRIADALRKPAYIWAAAAARA